MRPPLTAPGPFLALSHGDAECNNIMVHQDGPAEARLIDFEASACMSWALLRLHRFAVLDARAPGDHSRLQLVETLESAARTAQAHHALPHLAGWARRTAGALRRRWPDADLDLTDRVRFPPYSPRR